MLNEKYNRVHVNQAMKSSVLVQSNLEKSKRSIIDRSSIVSDSLLINP